ncbi:MAG: 50S ribosomal protein L18 [Holosporales bacterium]|jgi:large subunit ribosomal protein L18|nr:50S ribosomal protein L18 [Holosporales bacterium]
MLSSSELRIRRRNRQRSAIRRTIRGRYRLCIHRTGRHIYAQIIDDANSRTLVAASTLSAAPGEIANGGNKAAAVVVGQMIAKKAREKDISSVVFDRSGFLYHGRVKALADSAREHGLIF